MDGALNTGMCFVEVRIALYLMGTRVTYSSKRKGRVKGLEIFLHDDNAISLVLISTVKTT